MDSILTVGAAAPRFELPDQQGFTRSLDGFQRWTLLYWYPQADTPGCTAQAEGLRDQLEVFDEHGCDVVGASFDSVADLAAFADKLDLGFTLLSDVNHDVGRSYGVADGTSVFADRTAFLIDPYHMVHTVYRVDAPEFFADQVLDDLEMLNDGKAESDS